MFTCPSFIGSVLFAISRHALRLALSPIFRLGLYFNPLISWHEAPRNSGNCAQLLATIEQSADRRPRQLTVEAGLIESEKLGISERYFVPSSEAVAFRKSVSDQCLTLIFSRKFGLEQK